MGIKSHGTCLTVQVRRGALRLASPWSLKKGARTSVYLLEPGVSPASCTMVLAGFYCQQELMALHERTCARPKACEWVGAGMVKASQKLNESPGDTSDPEDRRKLAQLLPQAFARLWLCLWVTPSSPGFPLSRDPTPPRTCGEVERPRLPAAVEGRSPAEKLQGSGYDLCHRFWHIVDANTVLPERASRTEGAVSRSRDTTRLFQLLPLN